MTTLAQASTFNAEASLNAWMSAALQAFAPTPQLPTTPAIVQDAPQIAASLPCFSLMHIPVSAEDLWEGRWAGESKGERVRAILDVSCWVSRKASRDWLGQLRRMRDMALSAATSSTVVLISDYGALPENTVAPAIAAIAVQNFLITGDDGTWSDTPSSTVYKINIGGATLTPTEPDPNPDVERVRVLVDYDFVFRAS